ncbi:nicotinamidase [Frateuria aurantia]
MHAKISNNAALVVVDLQPDFMPGGALPCHDGDALIQPLDQLLRARRFQHVIATQDWHPPGHASFASAHPGRLPFEELPRHGGLQTLWPDHCVENTPGAALHPAVDWSGVDLILRKGRHPDIDSYSGFRENIDADGHRRPTGLAGWLRERGVTDVWVAGLARNVCVLWTAMDARTQGFRTFLSWDLSRPVAPSSDAATRATCAEHGIEIAEPERAD